MYVNIYIHVYMYTDMYICIQTCIYAYACVYIRCKMLYGHRNNLYGFVPYISIVKPQLIRSMGYLNSIIIYGGFLKWEYL